MGCARREWKCHQAHVYLHHSARAHRLLREAEGDPAAPHMLAELHGRIDELEPAQAQHLIELLVAEYGRGGAPMGAQSM